MLRLLLGQIFNHLIHYQGNLFSSFVGANLSHPKREQNLTYFQVEIKSI